MFRTTPLFFFFNFPYFPLITQRWTAFFYPCNSANRLTLNVSFGPHELYPPWVSALFLQLSLQICAAIKMIFFFVQPTDTNTIIQKNCATRSSEAALGFPTELYLLLPKFWGRNYDLSLAVLTKAAEPNNTIQISVTTLQSLWVIAESTLCC